MHLGWRSILHMEYSYGVVWVFELQKNGCDLTKETEQVYMMDVHVIIYSFPRLWWINYIIRLQ